MVRCPARDCGFEGDGNQPVAAHWRWKHDGPCPLTQESAVCGVCGTEFHYNPKKRTGDYCSNQCKFASRRSDIDEARLRTAYWETGSVSKTAERVGVSTSVAWRELVERDIHDPKSRNPGGRRDVECHGCGESFSKRLYEARRSRRHFCSVGCRRSWSEARRVQVECHTCGETLYRTPARVDRNDHHFCGYTCRDEWYSSEGGPSSLPPEEWRVDHDELTKRMRIAVYLYLARGEIKRSAWTALPFEPEELRQHLGAQFDGGMTWDNYGDWHVDHIVPVSAFNYSSTKNPDFKEAWSLGNLQPLWAEDNYRKHAKLSRPVQPSFRLEVDHA